MSILKKSLKKRDENASLVGVYIPKRLASYLSLFSLAKGQTKSSILKALITQWIESKQEKVTIDILVHEIALRAYKSWKKPVGKRDNFATFKTELKNELSFKGLAEFADRIISIVCDEKNKDKE
jgi:hypothetical protein